MVVGNDCVGKTLRLECQAVGNAFQEQLLPAPNWGSDKLGFNENEQLSIEFEYAVNVCRGYLPVAQIPKVVDLQASCAMAYHAWLGDIHVKHDEAPHPLR